MATASDGRAPYESRGDTEKSRKRPFRPDLNEEPQNVSQEGGRNNSTGVLDQVIVGISELEQMLKQRTFTSSEIKRLTALLHSRNCDNVVVERDVTSLPITPMASPQQPTTTENLLRDLLSTPMASSHQPTTIENLPGDLLSKIFIRLLSKQLSQMRSVSKSWNALLSHSAFIKAHLRHSINNNDQVFVIFYNNEPRNNYSLFNAYLSRSPPVELPNFIHLPRVGPGHSYRMVKVIGSVHGLICSCYGDKAIHIWNPSLSAVSTLPPYSFPLCSCYKVYLRFGFDPKTEDYKVVKITGLTEKLYEESTSSEEEDVLPSFSYVIKKWLEVEIYSMRTGSWKLISHSFPSHITRIFNKDEVCVDGHDGRLHWVGHTNVKGDSEVIVSFDLCSETFKEMTLPACILDYEYDRSNTLGVLGGKLCVTSRDGEGHIDVWVMEEYGVAESWVKRHVFNFAYYLGVSFNGFTSHNEFVIEDAEDGLLLFDPISDKTKVLKKYDRGHANTNRIVEYVDSLVWVAPPKRRATSQFQILKWHPYNRSTYFI